jgi:hypothetical protein
MMYGKKLTKVCVLPLVSLCFISIVKQRLVHSGHQCCGKVTHAPLVLRNVKFRTEWLSINVRAMVGSEAINRYRSVKTKVKESFSLRHDRENVSQWESTPVIAAWWNKTP